MSVIYTELLIDISENLMSATFTTHSHWTQDNGWFYISRVVKENRSDVREYIFTHSANCENVKKISSLDNWNFRTQNEKKIEDVLDLQTEKYILLLRKT